jgi:trehalose 6-phosphate phosphatase
MKPLFSKAGLKALKQQLQHKNIFAFDLDGSLIPIRRHFEKVRIPDQTKILLEKFTENNIVTVISGRSIKDLKRILKPVKNLKKITLIGNHGLEGLGHPVSNEMIKDWKDSLKETVGAIPGVILEDKKLTITVHYRLTKNREEARLKILKAIKELNVKPRVVLGEFVFNLLPDVGMDKGTAYLEFMTRNKIEYGFYLGDDWTDEDVFKIKSKKIFTVRVKPLKTSKAKFYIKKQPEINDVLKTLNHGM